MLTSLLITVSTLLPLLALLSQAVPVVHAVPVLQADAPPAHYLYPDPQPCLGVCSGIHDPNIIYDSDSEIYWRFTTSDNISIANSNSLEGPWTYRGPLLDKGTSIFVSKDQDIWVSRKKH
jgi:arabinan endo-1,5-alpha-L-arabinosidase